MIELPPKNQTTPVNLSKDVTFAWLFDGKALEISITQSTQAAIDIYIEANLAALRGWEPGQHFYSMQDISGQEVIITPYFRKRLEDVLVEMNRLNLKGDSVIILSNSIAGKLVQLYGWTFARKAKTIQQHWVIGKKNALQTLEKLLFGVHSHAK